MEYSSPNKAIADTVYTSISANRNENNISCHGGLILFSRANCPILYDLDNLQVVAELIGHKNEVNGQCFISDINQNQQPISKNEQQRLHIISTSHDETAIIWEVTISRRDTGQPKLIEHSILYQIKSPEKQFFTTNCSVRLEDNRFMTVTTTIEGNIHLWLNDQLMQTTPAKNCCFDSKFLSIRKDNHLFKLLFLAGGDNKVHIYQVNSEFKLIYLLGLTGFNDWVKCLDIMKVPGRINEFLLASACQDCFIRIWDIKLIEQQLDRSQIRTSVSCPLICDKNEATVYRLTATLETLLSGHEGIVHSLTWFRKQEDSLLQLISCSEDKTIVIWRSKVAPITNNPQANGTTAITNKTNQGKVKYELCPASGEKWKQVQRLGETGETNLPFLGVCLSSDEKIFYAQSLRGAIHSWQREDNKWEPAGSITGHFGPVTDLAWHKGCSYLLSTSWDKTCRLHAIARADNKWHEMARPQVHGHEINCLASLDFCTFATGAEEKTIRTFGATKFFLKNFETLARAKIPKEGSKIDDDQHNNMPNHAQLPALGLSNKGASSPYDIAGGGGGDDDHSKVGRDNDWNEISNLVKQLAQLDHLTTLPFEEILLQSTLWWETSKLFGHCNELYALASDHNGKFLASASKANRPDLANILIWETTKFRKVASIEHHSLTVTRLKFSPDDKYLLSVSRDRSWCLSERSSQQQLRNAYKKFIGTSKTSALHDRIIWDCCWTHDSSYFLTVSRDKKANLWSMDHLKRLTSERATCQDQSGDMSTPSTSSSLATDLESTCVRSQLFHCPIQAADSPLFEPFGATKGYIFALGFEDGSLSLGYFQRPEGGEIGAWHLLASFESFHQLPIKRLAFRPAQDEQDCDLNCTGELLLASGADDCVVKLTKFSFE